MIGKHCLRDFVESIASSTPPRILRKEQTMPPQYFRTIAAAKRYKSDDDSLLIWYRKDADGLADITHPYAVAPWPGLELDPKIDWTEIDEDDGWKPSRL